MGVLLTWKQASNMKFLVISCVLAVASCAPQNIVEEPIAILRQESFMNGGNFNHNFEAENGINVAAEGSENAEGASVMQGTYTFPLPDGSFASFNWIADANDFRVESPLLPVAPEAEHPIPAHAIEQIRFAEQQRAAGLRWDQEFNQWV